MIEQFSFYTLRKLYTRNHCKIDKIGAWNAIDPARDQIASTVVFSVWNRVMDPIAEKVCER